LERHFNRWFHYPYVFLNDGDFNSTFKETIANHTSSPVEFGKIDPTMWGYPDWVDKEVAREGIRKQGDAAIMYGGMESYHHMCRFYSGYVPPIHVKLAPAHHQRVDSSTNILS
jgi:mannosyltransferase